MSVQALPRKATETEDVEGLYTRIKNAYVKMRDGAEIAVNIYLPFSASKEGAKVPVICSYGPYGKDIHTLVYGKPKTDIYALMMKDVKPIGPDACFELADPLVWVRL